MNSIVMKYYSKIIVFLLLFSSGYAEAQTTTLKDNSFWFNLYDKFIISDKFYFDNEIQIRRVNFLDNIQLWYIQPGLIYKLNNNIYFGVGYYYQSTHAYGKNHPPITKGEHRIWEYIAIQYDVNKVNFNNRFMFEHRFKEQINTDVDPPEISGTIYAQNIRYRLNVTFPVVSFKNDKKLLARVSEELRIKFTNGLKDPDFDQNNLYGFLGYPFANNGTIWLGYGIDYYKVNAQTYVANSLVHIRLDYHFDLRKKNKQK